MPEISDKALEGVIGGAFVPLPDIAGTGERKSEVCGRYFARDGRDGEKPDCSFCIHSARNALGVYECRIDM